MADFNFDDLGKTLAVALLIVCAAGAAWGLIWALIFW